MIHCLTKQTPLNNIVDRIKENFPELHNFCLSRTSQLSFSIWLSFTQIDPKTWLTTFPWGKLVNADGFSHIENQFSRHNFFEKKHETTRKLFVVLLHWTISIFVFVLKLLVISCRIKLQFIYKAMIDTWKQTFFSLSVHLIWFSLLFTTRSCYRCASSYFMFDNFTYQKLHKPHFLINILFVCLR